MLAVERRGYGLPMSDQQLDQAAREVDNGMVVSGQDVALNRANGLKDEITWAQPSLAVDCMELRYSIARLTDEHHPSPEQQVAYVELQTEEVILSALRKTVVENPNDTMDLLAELESQKPKAAAVAAWIVGQTIDGPKRLGALSVPADESMTTLHEAITKAALGSGSSAVAEKLDTIVRSQPELIAA